MGPSVTPRERQRELHLWTPALPPGYRPFFSQLPTRSVVAQVHVRLCVVLCVFVCEVFFVFFFTNQREDLRVSSEVSASYCEEFHTESR